MKKFLLLIVLASLLAACESNTQKEETINTTIETRPDVTQVLYFHGKQRCISCNAIEKLTKEVVDSLANEKIVMKVIDISKKENEAIADKYELTWSSLILDRAGKVENLTDMGFSYAKDQPAVFKAKLIEALNTIAK